MSTSVNDLLLARKAEFYQDWTGMGHKPAEFDEFWDKIENAVLPEVLAAHRTEIETERTEAAKEAAKRELRRSNMSAAEKAAFVKEHGIEIFQKIPE